MDFLELFLDNLFDIILNSLDFISNPVIRFICQIIVIILSCVVFIALFWSVNLLTDHIIKHFEITNFIAKIALKIITVIITLFVFTVLVLIVGKLFGASRQG